MSSLSWSSLLKQVHQYFFLGLSDSRAVDKSGCSGGECGIGVGLDACDDLHDAMGHQRHLPQQPRPPNVVEVGDCEHVAVLEDERTLFFLVDFLNYSEGNRLQAQTKTTKSSLVIYESSHYYSNHYKMTTGFN